MSGSQALHSPRVGSRPVLSVFLRAWLLTALTDALFASSLSVFAYKSTVSRVWQGVASTVLGPPAFEGGMRTVLLGLLLHLGVAFWWTSVFLGLVMYWPRLRRLIASPGGVLAVAVIYGPLIWLVMSLIVIPMLTGRPTKLTSRWVVQLLGHIPFVALPIVAMISRLRWISP